MTNLLSYNLHSLWQLLCRAQSFEIEAISQFQSCSQATDRGRGTILKEVHDASSSIILYEAGFWEKGMDQSIHFKNALRWTFDFETPKIRIEHLRYGKSHPVFLFDLIATSNPHVLQSIEPHICKLDCYSSVIEWDEMVITFICSIKGAQKNILRTQRFYTY